LSPNLRNRQTKQNTYTLTYTLRRKRVTGGKTKKPRECRWTSSLADMMMVGPVVDDVDQRETRKSFEGARRVEDTGADVLGT
jgi:hypothetical protein